MERTFSPMIRQFSAIDGLQKAYTLVYSLDAEDGVQPEIWQDVMEELTTADRLEQKGGALRGQ